MKAPECGLGDRLALVGLTTLIIAVVVFFNSKKQFTMPYVYFYVLSVAFYSFYMFSPTRDFGRDHSYAVVARELGDAAASFETAGERSAISTRALRVTVEYSSTTSGYRCRAPIEAEREARDSR